MPNDKKKNAVLDAILYRDGKPVTDRPAIDVLAIVHRHRDPKHRDHNPDGQTTQAGVPIADAYIERAQELRRKQSEAGKNRTGQQTVAGKAIRAAIENAETTLRAEGKKITHRAIASKVHRSTERVRKLRKARAKS